MPALVVSDGPLAGRRFELEGELLLGREDAAITIADTEVSRRHAVFRIVGDRVEIEDLGSLNGTFVNGKRIGGVTRLAAGDVVTVGTISLAVEAPARSVQTSLSRQPGAAVTVVAPARTPPPPPAVAAPRLEAPAEPYGHYAEQAGGRTRIASRRLTPQLFTTVCIVGTAVALVVYFAAR